MAGPENKDRNPDEVEHDRGHVHHVIGPVTPARKKTVKIAENLLGPEINAALARVAVRKLDDRDSLRPEEQHEGNQPEPNRDSAVRGDARNDVEVEYRNDEERDKVPASE